jgi:hypothetical protein
VHVLRVGQLFSTKERVESVWHHESPVFNCIAVDAVVRQSSFRRTYSSVALFSNDNKQYSVDISVGDGNESERWQYEVTCVILWRHCKNYVMTFLFCS